MREYIYIYIYISLVLRNSHASKQFKRTTGTLVSTAEASFFSSSSVESDYMNKPSVVVRAGSTRYIVREKVAALETPSIHPTKRSETDNTLNRV